MKQEDLIAHILIHIKSLDKTKSSFLYEIRAYNNLIKKVKALPSQICKKDIDDMDITDGMKYKLVEWIKSKKPIDFEYKLRTINGIGSKLAKELIHRGVDSMRKLRSKKIFESLPIATKVDLIYKPLKRIPRHIIEYAESITKSHKIPFVYVGSYRRGSSSSSDMDVLIKANKGLKSDFVDQLNTKLHKLITFHKPYAMGDSKISTILTIHKYNVNVKMDIFITNNVEYPFALLYSTGSKEFNINMRSICKKKGLLLNQNGLFKDGVRIDCKGERCIFQELGMEYVPPSMR